jgi:hypothetical protein
VPGYDRYWNPTFLKKRREEKKLQRADDKRWKEEREAELQASCSSDDCTSSDYSSFEKSHP